MKKLFSLIAFAAAICVSAQTTVSGTITDSDGQPLPGANVVLDSSNGTVADFDGNFVLVTDQQPPFSISVSSVGFETSSVQVSSSNQTLSIQLSDANTQLDEIVVSASRVAQRIFESPVTVEKFNVQQITNSPSADFFTGLEEIRGVQVNRGSLVFNQVNTRGFGTVYNEGFVTLVDGMDNQAPIFGFAMGNMIGLNELDIQSVELLPGAASALYGADAYKGIMFMNSKSPFDSQGVSAYYKSGYTEQDVAGQNDFYDWGIRMAHAFSDKFAVKATFSTIRGTDWAAADKRSQDADGKPLDGVSNLDPLYNGINVYGDELGLSFDMTDTFANDVLPAYPVAEGVTLEQADPATLAQLQGVFGLYPNFFGADRQQINFSGYDESDLTDGKSSNYKYNLEARYRPQDNLEVILNSRRGGGKTILQGLSRYTIDNFSMTQNKVEVNWGNLNVRAYSTVEDSGDSYDTNAVGLLMFLGQSGGAPAWYNEYFKGFFLSTLSEVNPADPLAALNTMAQQMGGVAQGLVPLAAVDANADGELNIYDYVSSLTPHHAAGRMNANQNMLQPGTAAYNATFDQLTSTSAKLTDNTETYSYEFNYNFDDRISFADVIIGGSYRDTRLDTEGTVLTDYDGPIEYYQYGFYGQAKKSMDRITLTGSLRYDKSEFFDSNITPRLGLLYSLTDNQNIRLSYQTGFRNPTNQDQYIGLRGSRTVLMGSSPDSVERFRLPFQRATDGAVFVATGDHVFSNAISPALLTTGQVTPVAVDNVESEYIQSIDLGYRYNTPALSVDVALYYSIYDNLIATQDVLVPLLYADQDAATAIANGDLFPFSIDGNIEQEVSSYGASVAVNQALSRKLALNFSYDYNDLDYTQGPNSTYEAEFNTPKHRVKLSLVGRGINDNISFNLSARSNSAYDYRASFIDERIEANTVVDAQVSFDLNQFNSVLKVGATNIGGDDYVSLVGSGLIGQMFYTSLTFNP
jgi:outer membrane receptor protein involved in Fe transport